MTHNGWWSPSSQLSPPLSPMSRRMSRRLSRAANRRQCPRCTPAIYTHACYPHSFNADGCAFCAEEEDTNLGALRDRDLSSLHRTVPALRRRDIDTRNIKHHFYPEGGWGWIICGAAFLAHILSTGLQLAYGALHLYALKHLGERSAQHVVWMGAICVAVSRLTSAFVAGGGTGPGGRHSPRLAALLGGLLLPLACLFTSFATKLHQAILSYGLVLGIGCGLVREAAGLFLGAYFKKRRQFVELVAHAGGGVGIALFSVFYKEAVGKLGWRLGLQAVTGLVGVAFFLGAVYRSASLYHPQRRAILHLKNQRRKVKEKKNIRPPKPPLLDFTPLRSRPARVLLLAASLAAFGVYTPIFYLALQGYKEGLEDSALVLLQTFLGFAAVLGCAGFGIVLVKPSTQCLISKQYLCQTALLGIGLSLVALSTVRGYHGYVLFAWLYGLCLGGFLYSIKMLTMERIRARHFAKVWGYVQGAEAIPIVLGVPMAGYIDQQAHRAGYYFAFAATLSGAMALFFVGFSRRPDQSNSLRSAITATTMSEVECPCTLPSPRPVRFDTVPVAWCTCTYWPVNHVNRLPKSLSYAAPLNRSYCEPQFRGCSCGCGWKSFSVNGQAGLRHSKSVPEGLARRRCNEPVWTRGGSSRSLNRGCQARHCNREHHVIEQITTSV